MAGSSTPCCSTFKHGCICSFLLQSGFRHQKMSLVVSRAVVTVSETFHALANYAVYATGTAELLWMPSAAQLMP